MDVCTSAVRRDNQVDSFFFWSFFLCSANGQGAWPVCVQCLDIVEFKTGQLQLCSTRNRKFRSNLFALCSCNALLRRQPELLLDWRRVTGRYLLVRSGCISILPAQSRLLQWSN